jgi:hypothetical protein
VSFIWNYLHSPQPESDGTVPEQSDYHLTLSLGANF